LSTVHGSQISFISFLIFSTKIHIVVIVLIKASCFILAVHEGRGGCIHTQTRGRSLKQSLARDILKMRGCFGLIL